MKIAFDAKRFFSNSSGLGNYSRDLVRIFAEYYPENQYFLLNKKQTEKGAEILERENVHYQKTSDGIFSRQLKMGRDAQKMDAEIFHGLSGELPLKWTNKRVKKIVSIHDLIFLRYPKYYSWFDRKIHLWKFKKAAENADLIIAISEQTKRDIVDFLKVPEEKIQVAYQGCHPAFKENFSEEYLEEIRAKYALPQRFILNVGTIEERKNLLNILKAVEGLEIPVVAIGKKKKKYFARIENFLRKSKTEIHFPKNVSMQELAAVYRLADIFVYPSEFEGFGIPIIEALFSKTPVITGNVSSLPEAGGPDSLFVNPNSVDDLRSKILFLWNNEAERERRAEKGFEYVQKFQDEKIAVSLMGAYHSVTE